MKKLFAIILASLLFVNLVCITTYAHEDTENLFKKYYQDFLSNINELGYDTSCVVFFETDDWQTVGLTNRTEQNALFVEILYGVKLDTDGNGKVQNTTDNFYNFIAYGKEEPENTLIITFSLYNPENNYEDDIIERFDFWGTDSYNCIRHP